MYRSTNVRHWHKVLAKACAPLTWHVHISQLKLANGIRLQRMLARTDTCQWHYTSDKHACTNMACAHLASDISQRNESLGKACMHQLCRVHIDWEINVVVWVHQPCNITRDLCALVRWHQPITRSNKEGLHITVVSCVRRLNNSTLARRNSSWLSCFGHVTWGNDNHHQPMSVRI